MTARTPYCGECRHSIRVHVDGAGLCTVIACPCQGFVSLPYPDEAGHTSGHSGTDTSAARAHRRDSSGETGRVQRAVMAYVGMRGVHGATVVDIRRVVTEHHGS